jgi:cell division protein FtsL
MTTSTPTPDTESETPEQKREGRAAEYRRLALEADTLGAASPLPHVREKHEKAAETWMALAEREGRPSPTRPALT